MFISEKLLFLCKRILMLNISNIHSSGSTPTSGPSLPLREYVELQVDYWTVIQKPESTDKGDKSSKKDSNKSSLKSSFKSVQVTRLPHGSAPQGDNQMIPFTLVTVMREKKQKSRWFFMGENCQDYFHMVKSGQPPHKRVYIKNSLISHLK